MKRVLIALLLVAGLAGPTYAGDLETAPMPAGDLGTTTAQIGSAVQPGAFSWREVIDAATRGTELAQACCKVCRKGKACGNSCIARWKNCHKPRGCACDGE